MLLADCIAEHQVTADLTRLSLVGDLGGLESETLETAFAELVAARPARVTVDMSRVTLICSVSIGLLVALQRSLREQGGELLLSKPNPQVVSILHTLHLTRIFTIDA